VPPQLGDAEALSHLPPLREIIREHGLSARRSLGQNFLLDLNLTGRIARAAGPLEAGTTIEVGPGPGGLTRALLAAGAVKVVAIERDRRAVAALASLVEAAEGRLTVIEADALEVDIARLGEAPRRVVANLPYNVATPLAIGWLKQIREFDGLTLLFQKEVAQRLAARRGTGAYGRLSVLAQWLADVRLLFDIPARAFTPPPKITSTVVRLAPRPAPAAPAETDLLEAVTAAAFGQRRKMLRQSLKSLDDPEALLGAAQIDPTLRAEALSVEEFCRLAQALADRRAAAASASGR
jgi:16S rRNA (adenine1518-N6/adenine1519-N6)-dimethyltransferase